MSKVEELLDKAMLILMELDEYEKQLFPSLNGDGSYTDEYKKEFQYFFDKDENVTKIMEEITEKHGGTQESQEAMHILYSYSKELYDRVDEKMVSLKRLMGFE